MVCSSERQVIGNCFTTHFKNLFFSSAPILDDDLLSLFDNFISSEANDSLYALHSEQEIFSVLTSIGSTKAPGSQLFFIRNIGIMLGIWSLLVFRIFLEIIDFSRNKIILLLLSFSNCWVFILFINSNPLTCLIFISLSICFVPFRNIQDNIILAHELFNVINQKLVEEVLWLSKLIWKRLLIIWNGASF